MKTENKIKELYNKYPFPNENLSLNELDKYKWILNSLPSEIIRGSKILDAGCGTGELACFLSRFGDVTGIDFNEKSIEIAKKNSDKFKIKNINFLVDNLTNLNHKEKYDYIFCFGVLHHIPNIDKAIGQLKELLKENGYIIIGVYNLYGWMIHKYIKKKLSITRMMDSYHHPYEVRYTKKKFEKILLRNDLEIVGMWRKIPEILRLFTGRGTMMSFCVVKESIKD